MDDMYKSIKAFLYDRTSSPLFGAFIISWSVINYRVILTIFSGESLSAKFEIIDQLYSVTLFDQSDHLLGLLYYGFMLPALVTVSYIYLYPFLAKPVYEHSLKKQKELREIKQKEEGNRLLSHKESLEIYREMAVLENKYNQQEEKHSKQVAGLLSNKQEAEAYNVPTWIRQQSEDSESSDAEVKGNKLTSEAENVLMAFRGTTDSNRKQIEDLFDLFEINGSYNTDRLKYEVDELVNKGLLAVYFDDEYFLTHEGRGYLVKVLSNET